MRKIEKPAIDQKDICDAFPSLMYKAIILKESSCYERHLDDLSVLYESEKARMSDDKDYKAEQNKMYSKRFSNSGYKDIYRFYKEIRETSKSCPFCNYPTRTISQLDHFLPKSEFPSLSITVDNLVPICSDCNSAQGKGTYFSCEKREMLIHPYFDGFINKANDYIRCEIIKDDPIGFIFKIARIDEWDEETYLRVKFHFQKLKLDELYSNDFEADFANVLEELRFSKSDCEDRVRLVLKQKIAALEKVGNKPWCIAGYKALSESEWFFDSYI